MIGIGSGSIKRGTLLTPSKDESSIKKMNDAFSGKTAGHFQIHVI